MMPMAEYQIKFAWKAKEDIVDISRYITYELLEPNISKHFIKDLKQSISKLQFFPYKFPLIQDDILKERGIRCMSHKNYYIFYEVADDLYTVIIIRVGYMRRNWRHILQK